MIITENMVDEAYWAYGGDKGMRAALEAALSTIPLDAVTVERCAQVLDERALFWSRGNVRTQERMEVKYCALLLRALPVAPPFPEPLRVKPDRETEVWCAHPAFSDFAMPFTWRGSGGDLAWFERGLCHATCEAAATHGSYLASLSAKTKGGL